MFEIASLLPILYLLILISLIVFRKQLGKNIYIVILSIVFIFLIETGAGFLARKYNYDYNNTYLFVIGIIGIVYSLYFIYFYKSVTQNNHKKIQLLLILLHSFNFGISSIVVEDFFTVFPATTNMISSVLLLVSITVFFRDVFNSDRVLRIKKYFPFWYSVSLAIIFVGSVPLLYFGPKNLLLNRTEFQSIIFGVNIIGYGLMLFGVLFARDHKKLV